MFLTTDEQQLIQQHLLDDPSRLLLRQHPTIDFKKIATQVQARQKAKLKLPHWYANPLLVFPVPVSVEQSSSELTAHYKAQMVSGLTLMDGTGGMGIDSLAFAKRCDNVIYIERNSDLAALSAYNFEVLAQPNIQVCNADTLDFLQNHQQPIDWLYLDPSRRASDQKRVYKLADCEPNIPAKLPFLLSKTQQILVKLSPLIDLQQACAELQNHVSEIHVVAVKNECKEILLVLTAVTNPNPTIKAIDLGSHTEAFVFALNQETQAIPTFAAPQNYLYEPHAALLKAGSFKLIALRYNIHKIAAHSHLYTSEHHVEDFPGRSFEVLATVKVQAKEVAAYLPDRKANLSIRNFPSSTDALRKQLQIKEGGEFYLFATTLANNDKKIVICKSISKKKLAI
jgi:THUMP domain-like